MRISVEHSLGQGDMVDALAALALAEQVDGPLVKALRNAHPREPIRERYLVQVVFGFQDAGRALDRQMGDNVVALASTMLADPAIRKARGARAPLRLTQAQLDELLLLIRLHYRSAIRVGVGAGWGIDPATEARWKAAGVLAPDVRLGGLVGDAFTACPTRCCIRGVNAGRSAGSWASRRRGALPGGVDSRPYPVLY